MHRSVCVCFLELVKVLVGARMQHMFFCECLQMLVFGRVSTQPSQTPSPLLHILIYAGRERLAQEEELHTKCWRAAAREEEV